MRQVSGSRVLVEGLEERLLQAATVLSVAEVSAADGIQLRVRGTPDADSVQISQSGQDLTVTDSNTGWSQTYSGPFNSIQVRVGKGFDRVVLDPSVALPATLYGGNGADTLVGGSGDTTFYGGYGQNNLIGGTSDDAFVLVGNNKPDTITGGGGQDSFWLDNRQDQIVTDLTADQVVKGVVHRISNFYDYNQTSNAASVTDVPVDSPSSLPDPTLTSTTFHYSNFADHPLFSDAGPSASDVRQGYLGDCYYLATLSSIAKADPGLIRQSVVGLGDGTYAVHFARGGNDVYVRVDADLPTWSSGAMAYAGQGAQGSLWVAIMEKAYAFFRRNLGTYASLEGGWMNEVYSALGATSSTIAKADDGPALLQQIKDLLDLNRSVTFGVLNAPAGSPLISYHAYMVDSVGVDAQGNPTTLTLRNPWGFDGAGFDGADDGYVTVTAEQALGAFWSVMSAAV